MSPYESTWVHMSPHESIDIYKWAAERITWATPIGCLMFPYVIGLVFFSFQWPWHTPRGRYIFLLFLFLNKEYISICTPKEVFAEAYFDPDPLCPVWHGGRDDDIFHRSVPGIISIYCSPVVPSPASFICVFLFQEAKKMRGLIRKWSIRWRRKSEKRKMEWLVKEVEKEVRRKKEAETAQDSKIFF